LVRPRPEKLFGQDEVERFRVEWREIQARFVDDPREAVQGADHLVAEVIRSLATMFNEHKHELEGQWRGGSDAETEDLRQALRRPLQGDLADVLRRAKSTAIRPLEPGLHAAAGCGRPLADICAAAGPYDFDSRISLK
jgi:hypothetical protein